MILQFLLHRRTPTCDQYKRTNNNLIPVSLYVYKYLNAQEETDG